MDVLQGRLDHYLAFRRRMRTLEKMLCEEPDITGENALDVLQERSTVPFAAHYHLHEYALGFERISRKLAADEKVAKTGSAVLVGTAAGAVGVFFGYPFIGALGSLISGLGGAIGFGKSEYWDGALANIVYFHEVDAQEELKALRKRCELGYLEKIRTL